MHKATISRKDGRPLYRGLPPFNDWDISHDYETKLVKRQKSPACATSSSVLDREVILLWCVFSWARTAALRLLWWERRYQRGRLQRYIYLAIAVLPYEHFWRDEERYIRRPAIFHFIAATLKEFTYRRKVVRHEGHTAAGRAQCMPPHYWGQYR